MTSLTATRAKMPADPNMNFYLGMLPSSTPHSSRVVSFQSSSSSGSAMVFPMDSSGGLSGVSGMGSPGTMSSSSSLVQTGNSSASSLLDQVPGVKMDSGLAADWLYDEQLLLEAGLRKYSDEPKMIKYIKIAASLREKTVRDVALRCRWMTRKENSKRRKQDEYYLGKKVKDRKDKVMESTFVSNVHPSQPVNHATYPFPMAPVDQANQFSCEVPVIDGATQCIIEENAMLLCKIEENFNTLQLQENLSLLHHSRINFSSILKGMSEMPGIMSQMLPLPVSINMELAEKIIPGSSQQRTFGIPGRNR